MAEDHDRSVSSTSGRPAAGIASHRRWEIIKRAFIEFLRIPSMVIAAFLALAVIIFFVDERRAGFGQGSASEVWGGLFSDAQAARDFLGVVAASIITVTSITLSLLLIAVQQGAAALTSQVFDQFLRRRVNQLYFGFFIGLALYSLVVLASVHPSHQPVYGVAVAGVMTAAALYMLILLIYTTINQMRPVVIIGSIHDHTLKARACQAELLQATRRVPKLRGGVARRVTTETSGYLARIDVAAIDRTLKDTDAEAVILASIGDFLAFGDPVAEIRARDHDVSSLEPAIRDALAVEDQRNLDSDPAFGVEQLVTIGWTSISTAKSNPVPGLLAIRNLRDLLARWLQTDAAFRPGDGGAEAPAGVRVVYSDNLPQEVMRGLESLVTVASESMQHQSAAEVYRAFASLFQRFPPHLQRQAVDLLLRSLQGLGDHMLTSDLDQALLELIDVLDAAGQPQCATAMRAARDRLALTLGQLRSRSNRC